MAPPPHPSEPDPAAPSLREVLAQGVAALGRPVFATVDGGQFDDLPGLLKAAGLSCRSLFLDHADVEVERAGPWLVPVDEETAAPRLLEVTGVAAPVVFWRYPAGEDALFQHLRSLNLVRIPDEDDELKSANDVASEITVLFRHWDPEVLLMILPLLDGAQFARVLGEADKILIPTGASARGYRVAVPLEDGAKPAPGMLRLDGAQLTALKAAMAERSDARISGFLRDASPEFTSGMSEADLRRHIARSEVSGTELGLSSERAHARWAYLMLMTDGRASTVPEARAFIVNGADHPDQQVKKLIEHSANALRRGDAQGAP